MIALNNHSPESKGEKVKVFVFLVSTTLIYASHIRILLEKPNKKEPVHSEPFSSIRHFSVEPL